MAFTRQPPDDHTLRSFFKGLKRMVSILGLPLSSYLVDSLPLSHSVREIGIAERQIRAPDSVAQIESLLLCSSPPLVSIELSCNNLGQHEDTIRALDNALRSSPSLQMLYLRRKYYFFVSMKDRIDSSAALCGQKAPAISSTASKTTSPAASAASSSSTTT